MPKYSKKKSKTPSIISVFQATVVAIVGIGLTALLFLITQNQDLRQQASTQNNTDIVVCPLDSSLTDCNYFGPLGIQQALSAVEPNGQILIKAGQYALDSTSQTVFRIDSKNISIKGEGRYQTTLLHSSNTENDPGSVIFDIGGNSHVAISDLGIVQKGSSLDQRVFAVKAFAYGRDQQNITVESCYFEGGLGFIPISIGSYDHSLTNSLVVGNIMIAHYGGIKVYSGSTSDTKAEIKNNILFGSIDPERRIVSIISSDPIDGVSGVLTAVVQNNAAGGNGANAFDCYNASGNEHSLKCELTNNIAFQNSRLGFSSNTVVNFALFEYNLGFENRAGNWPSGWPGFPPTTNISADALFQTSNTTKRVKAEDYMLLPNSPARNGGNPQIFDPDGSRSDIGPLGGPNACKLLATLPGCTLPSTPESKTDPKENKEAGSQILRQQKEVDVPIRVSK
ncbi:MAG: hypothetical protein H6773_02470 [Pseudomonadales bacterium]|nr:hypothetical protein [Candidatus Woesebacteria bacterium]MCB9801019.1 hypothetical protein [Pseudomonadales bacterium]